MTQTLLPPNATAFEIAQAQTSARMFDVDTDIIRRERRADLCDMAFLPLLAWENSVHHWTGTNENSDRAAVANSFGDHCTYGSPEALEKEIALDVNYPVNVREFFEFGGEWPDFMVEIPITPDVTPPDPADVLASALRRKNVRDWPSVRRIAKSGAPSGIALTSRLIATLRTLPLDPTIRSSATAFVGAAGRLTGTITTRPL